MEKSYITRRIDDLGRIVIPKEIRRNLKIKDNDQIEINVIDNKIVLNKYNNNEKDEVITILLHSLKKLFNGNVLYTNREYILEYDLLNNEIIKYLELSENIINVIEKRQMITSLNSNIKIMNYSSYIINPIIIHGDLLGSIIVYGENEINLRNIDIFKFINIFLENYLE